MQNSKPRPSAPTSARSGANINLTADSESRDQALFPRISRPFELIRHEYDVVVIGSGYGGGVAASRMARGGKSVCVLERGRERWPGEYPVTLKEALPELHTSGEFVKYGKPGKLVDIGDPIGLYHLIVGDGQNAFVANGLGGTSLLNANVFLRADAKTLGMNVWPPELRSESELEPYYQMAEHMLQPAPYPNDWPQLPKLELLEKQAEKLGKHKNFYRVPQTTRFSDGPNSTGIDMKASTLTGNDSTGINDGSKTTTLVTYLSDAWNWGAEIFCECEVRHIKQSGDGYDVYFAWHGGKRGRFKEHIYEDLLWVHAKEFCFVGAGSLGTTEILLRSKANGLPLSDQIGRGLSGNGDILSFGYNCMDQVNSMGKENPSPEMPIGPTITGVIDCRDQENPLNGFVIEEGAVPESLVGLLQTMLEALPGKVYPRDLPFKDTLQRSLASIRSRVFGPHHANGSVERTQIYLIMSHDSNQAIMTLVDNRPVVKFMGVGRSEHVQYLNKLLADATNAVGGTLVNNPFYAALNKQEITVHPIGGACISADGSAELGSTTHLGELLTGKNSEHHKGLVVVDGALVPTALGANPFATITALAERSLKGLASKHKIAIDYETSNGLLDPRGKPAFPAGRKFKDQLLEESTTLIRRSASEKESGVEFTEVMTGHIHLGSDIEDFRVAENAAKSLSQTARFFLTMCAWDENLLLSDSSHQGMLTGTFTHGSLPASPYMVLRGEFQLFNVDPRTPGTKNLTYNFDMVGTDGSVLHFNGYKVVDDSAAGSLYDIWKATSTLFVTITKPDTKQVVARGVLNIAISDLASELTTLTSSGASKSSKLLSTFKFLSYFTRNIIDVFLGPFGRLQYPLATTFGYYDKQPPSLSTTVLSKDNVSSPLLCWDPTPNHASPLGTILLIPGAAVDSQIFAMPTLKRNAIEFYTSAGYRCYVVTHRVGRTPEALKPWTSYDARLDVAAALTFIRERDGPKKKPYVVAHCAGAIALSAGLLDGTIPCKEWLAGITFSNVSFTPIFARVNMLKASQPISLTSLYGKLAGQWFGCATSKHPGSFVQAVVNQILRFYPVGGRKELCDSATCHRSSLAFGRLWTHENLNDATHKQLDRFLGGTSMTSLAHLVAMGTKGEVLMDDKKTSLVTEENLRRWKDVPILFFSGEQNTVYAPENTDKSYSMMRDRFGPDNYQRSVFPGKGHLDCWMSEKAQEDVWPRVLRHVKQSFGMEH